MVSVVHVHNDFVHVRRPCGWVNGVKHESKKGVALPVRRGRSYALGGRSLHAGCERREPLCRRGVSRGLRHLRRRRQRGGTR